jgi:ketosteroid isomerase-like protein
MKHLFVLIVTVLIASSAVAQTANSQVSPGKNEQQVLEAEKSRFDVMLKGDADALSSFLADELTYTHTTGRTDTKSSFVTSLKSGAVKYQAIEPEDRAVHVYGDAAVVTGQAKLKVVAGAQELSFRVRYTEVCVRRDGRWQLVAWQSTRLPD